MSGQPLLAYRLVRGSHSGMAMVGTGLIPGRTAVLWTDGVSGEDLEVAVGAAFDSGDTA